MTDNIPLPIAIALIITTSGFIYFLVKSWIAAKERDDRELDSRFDDSYRHIDRVEEALDRRIPMRWLACGVRWIACARIPTTSVLASPSK